MALLNQGNVVIFESFIQFFLKTFSLFVNKNRMGHTVKTRD